MPDQGSMPKINAMEILAGLVWVCSQAIAWGIIKHAPSQEVLSGSATILAVGFAWANNHLRGKRVIAHAMVHAANAAASAPTPPVSVVTPPVVTGV